MKRAVDNKKTCNEEICTREYSWINTY